MSLHVGACRRPLEKSLYAPVRSVTLAGRVGVVAVLSWFVFLSEAVRPSGVGLLVRRVLSPQPTLNTLAA